MATPLRTPNVKSYDDNGRPVSSSSEKCEKGQMPSKSTGRTYSRGNDGKESA